MLLPTNQSMLEGFKQIVSEDVSIPISHRSYKKLKDKLFGIHLKDTCGK